MKKYIVFVIMCLILLAGCAAAAGLFSGWSLELTDVSMRMDTNSETVLFGQT